MLKWIDGFYLYLKWTFFRSEKDLHEHQLAILSVLSTDATRWWYRSEVIDSSKGAVKPYWYSAMVGALEDQGLVRVAKEDRNLHVRKRLLRIVQITQYGVRKRAEETAKERDLLPSDLLEPQPELA